MADGEGIVVSSLNELRPRDLLGRLRFFCPQKTHRVNSSKILVLQGSVKSMIFGFLSYALKTTFKLLSNMIKIGRAHPWQTWVWHELEQLTGSCVWFWLVL